MADPEVRISLQPEESQDVEMAGDGAEVEETGAPDMPGDEDNTVPETPRKPRLTFADYLKSPIITLSVGPPTSSTALSAHQLLLEHSPFLASAISSPSASTTISLPDEDLAATSAVLEYLYTGEYFPHKLPSRGTLQTDPSLPDMDTTGDQLLQHARVYTLAEKLGMPSLRTLALSKIHLVNSTAVAELAYARYVYSHTDRADTTIRKPVASFWGQRSHVLRHETEGSFRGMCLEFPEFAFDVLSFVLDAEEKREERKRKSTGGDGETSGRKRARG